MRYLRVGYSPHIDIEKIFRGSLLFFDSSESTERLISWAEECLAAEFGDSLELSTNDAKEKNEFVAKVQAVKSRFTNHEMTKELLEEVILLRYAEFSNYDLFYDVPRIRIIPTSKLLKSGVSYNYLPHRDTWYGAGQEQINHWLSIKNVSDEATFFIAPSYFEKKVENSSKIFDLNTWDREYRQVANKSVEIEMRPHPMPLAEISEELKIGLDLAPGSEICFSGHHVHGSSENVSTKVRVSIDYRVSIPSLPLSPPKNIDSLATGNYLDFMTRHPRFGC